MLAAGAASAPLHDAPPLCPLPLCAVRHLVESAKQHGNPDVMCLLPLLLYRVEQKRQRRAGAAGVVPPAAALDAAAVPPGAQAMDAAVPAKPPVQFEANEAVNPAMMPLRYWRCGKLCASPAERHAHVLQACETLGSLLAA